MAIKKNELNLEPLQKALKQLEKGLLRSQKNLDDEELRDGAIQRFEYTYGLACHFIKRYLEYSVDTPVVIDTLSFPELVRTAWEQGLLKSSWDVWHKYREARNNTSHVYDEKKAKSVYAVIPEFLAEVTYLYQQLQNRIS